MDKVEVNIAGTRMSIPKARLNRLPYTMSDTNLTGLEQHPVELRTHQRSIRSFFHAAAASATAGRKKPKVMPIEQMTQHTDDVM
jgi:hypothetical protein